MLPVAATLIARSDLLDLRRGHLGVRVGVHGRTSFGDSIGAVLAVGAGGEVIRVHASRGIAGVQEDLAFGDRPDQVTIDPVCSSPGPGLPVGEERHAVPEEPVPVFIVTTKPQPAAIRLLDLLKEPNLRSRFGAPHGDTPFIYGA
jgi:hypothetical protein